MLPCQWSGGKAGRRPLEVVWKDKPLEDNRRRLVSLLPAYWPERVAPTLLRASSWSFRLLTLRQRPQTRHESLRNAILELATCLRCSLGTATPADGDKSRRSLRPCRPRHRRRVTLQSHPAPASWAHGPPGASRKTQQQRRAARMCTGHARMLARFQSSSRSPAVLQARLGMGPSNLEPAMLQCCGMIRALLSAKGKLR